MNFDDTKASVKLAYSEAGGNDIIGWQCRFYSHAFQTLKPHHGASLNTAETKAITFNKF